MAHGPKRPTTGGRQLKKKLELIKRDRNLATLFNALMATFIAFNALLIYLFVGPLASAGVHSLVLGLAVTVAEVGVVMLIFRAFRHEESAETVPVQGATS